MGLPFQLPDGPVPGLPEQQPSVPAQLHAVAGRRRQRSVGLGFAGAGSEENEPRLHLLLNKFRTFSPLSLSPSPPPSLPPAAPGRQSSQLASGEEEGEECVGERRREQRRHAEFIHQDERPGEGEDDVGRRPDGYRGSGTCSDGPRREERLFLPSFSSPPAPDASPQDHPTQEQRPTTAGLRPKRSQENRVQFEKRPANRAR